MLIEVLVTALILFGVTAAILSDFQKTTRDAAGLVTIAVASLLGAVFTIVVPGFITLRRPGACARPKPVESSLAHAHPPLACVRKRRLDVLFACARAGST